MINGDWISVDERVPEIGELVLIWYEYFRYGEYNSKYPTYGIGYYAGVWGGPDDLGDNARVLYWKPLPEVPEGEKHGVQKC